MYAFVSYQTDDKVVAGKVKAVLEGLGIPAFLAHEDIGVSEEWRIKAVNLTDIEVDLDVVKVIPETTARRHKAVPFAKEENVLFVSMVDPRDFFAVEDMQLRTGFEVQPYLALPGDIDALLDKAYGVTTVESAPDVSVEDTSSGFVIRIASSPSAFARPQKSTGGSTKSMPTK